jgi:hypothetical protein
VSNGLMIALVVAVLAAGIAVFIYAQIQRTKRLKSKFGPEYDRLVDQYGSPKKAEEDLAHREKRVEKLHVRNLDPGEADRFSNAWLEEQARFVDNPREAVANADRLVADLMKARGYPVSDFDQRAADISVDHPLVVDNYRAAHAIAIRDARGQSSTEDLRQAMVHYRTLFEDLLDRRIQPDERQSAVPQADEVKR